MSGLTIRAPAKINFTLEVLGRRPDGYHEILSVAQTVDLWDEMQITPAAELSLEVTGLPLPQAAQGEENLVLRAARLLQEWTGWPYGARIRLHKAIPPAAGLGGGSSDAAAALRGLNLLWDLRLPRSELWTLAARLGSDVPFFLVGGTAQLSGRGDQVTPLRDLPPHPLVLAIPTSPLADKTAVAYSRLQPQHYSDGHHTRRLIAALQCGASLPEADLVNCFEYLLTELYPDLVPAWSCCQQAGRSPHLTGSGPAFFLLPASFGEATESAAAVRACGLQVMVVKTIKAREALGED